MAPNHTEIIPDSGACDVCGTSPLVGVRYKCVNCDDFNMCEKCDASGAGEHEHFPMHVFLKLRQPLLSAKQKAKAKALKKKKKKAKKYNKGKDKGKDPKSSDGSLSTSDSSDEENPSAESGSDGLGGLV